VVYEKLYPAMEKDPSLKEKFQQAGGTPKAAYELGKKISEREEVIQDPEAFKEKIRKEILEEMKGGQKEKPRTKGLDDMTLSGVNSKKSFTDTPEHGGDEDDLDDVLNEVNKRRRGG
jgi:hypothetical protein